MSAALRYETVRVLTIRSTWLSLAATFIGVLVLGYLASVPFDGNEINWWNAFVQPLLLTAILSSVVAAQNLGQEYRFGLIRLTLTAFPERDRILVAKFVSVVVVGTVFALVSFLASWIAVTLHGHPLPPEGGESVDATFLLRGIVFVVLWSLSAWAIAGFTRQTALGIALPIVIGLILEQILGAVLSDALPWLAGCFPGRPPPVGRRRPRTRAVTERSSRSAGAVWPCSPVGWPCSWRWRRGRSCVETPSPDPRVDDRRNLMSRTRVHNFTISLDGFGTGEGLAADAPFGHAGHRLHAWMMATRFWHQLGVVDMGDSVGSEGVDNAFAERFAPGIGAEIMGAGKFGPPGWQDDPEWRGWWGEDPPFHTPTFVLTHRPRPSLEMEGGTTFHFLDVSPAEALAAAQEAAGGLDVRIGGGPTTVREFLAAGLIDHLHVVQVPILLGRGVRLWDGLEGLEQEYAVEMVSSPSGVTHLTFTR